MRQNPKQKPQDTRSCKCCKAPMHSPASAALLWPFPSDTFSGTVAHCSSPLNLFKAFCVVCIHSRRKVDGHLASLRVYVPWHVFESLVLYVERRMLLSGFSLQMPCNHVKCNPLVGRDRVIVLESRSVFVGCWPDRPLRPANYSMLQTNTYLPCAGRQLCPGDAARTQLQVRA